jgi:hypothetical protein
MTEETFKRLRIAIVGGCQVVGLATTAERMLPGAEVKAWHVGVHPKDSDEDLLALLPGFDIVISQISDSDGHAPLGITRLRERRLPVVFLPSMVFTGFHPDITYIDKSGGLIRGLETDYHSIIVAAAFTLGLPENRVAELFNAYIFAELGYFDVFEAARKALFASFDEARFDLRPHFDHWMRQVGQFMYTINHPHILVLTVLCRLALVSAGCLDATVPLPDGVTDALGTHFIWPIYPALARRIGLTGSTTFLRGSRGPDEKQARELPLADYICRSFQVYSALPKDVLRVGPIAGACKRLDAVVNGATKLL